MHSFSTYNFIGIQDFFELDSAKMQEYSWGSHFSISDVQDAKAWAQYHIDINDLSAPEWLDENSFLPLISDKINTWKMKCPTMRLNIKAANAFNPGQTLFDTSDCPIYALAKEAIYHFQDKFPGYCAIFGGRHIEQCILVVHDQLVAGSGLKEIFETYSLATIGASAVVDINQIKRRLYCVQVVLCLQYRKLVEAAKTIISINRAI